MSGCTQLISGVSASNNSQLVTGTVQGSVYFGNRQNLNDLNDLLKSLPTAADAAFNAYGRQHNPTCLPDTRVELLQEIYNWADEQDKPCIFWLSGFAGTGKSTVAQTVAAKYSEKGSLWASFFFSRGGGDVGHAGKFVTSIAVQLANNIPALKRNVCDAFMKRSDITSQSLRDQWRHLVLGPLSKLDGEDCHVSYILVVDALDECEDENNIRVILQLLAEVRSVETVRLRVFLTSRPEIPIRHGFYQIPDAKRQDFVLHNISKSIVNHDIGIFLQNNLKFIASECSFGAGWPGEHIVEGLVDNASGLFIWAATACLFIREGKQFAGERLDRILLGSGNAITEPEKHLNEIYTTVLEHSITQKYTDKEKEELYCLLRHILGNTAVLFSPLSVYSLSRLLGVTEKVIYQTLEDLHSVLDVPNEQARPLRLHHPSFRDFLLNNRCKNVNFWVDEKKAHQTLANRCIQLMSTSLKQDICGLNSPGVLVSDVEISRIERSIPPQLQYACLYWIQHFLKSGAQFYDDYIRQFLQVHLLHWLEALGWMKKTSEGILAIFSLALIQTDESPDLYALIHDAKRFVLYNRSVIEQAPLQLYYSALVFAPEKSVVKGLFEKRILTSIQMKPEVQGNWSAVLQTLESGSSSVNVVVFSLDGQLLGTASDKETRLWDPVTGASRGVLKGQSGQVKAMAFSPNSQLLATASNEEVRLWDPTTAKPLDNVLKCWSGHVKVIAFSPDGQLLAIASDKEVELWDPVIGASRGILKGTSGQVEAISFSLDGQCLATASNKVVRLWDPTTRASRSILKGQSGRVKAIAFSPNSQHLATASNEEVRYWDTTTAMPLDNVLEGWLGQAEAMAFSPNSQLLAVALKNSVMLYDSITGAFRGKLDGHSQSIMAITFSPSAWILATSSLDKTTRLWDLTTIPSLGVLLAHSDWINSIAFSPEGLYLVSASDDKTIRLWDTAAEAVCGTFEEPAGKISAVAFSPSESIIASASKDSGTVKLWNWETRESFPLNGHSSWVRAVAFSVDGKLLASASQDQTVRLWGWENRTLKGTLEHDSSVWALAFSPDGRFLASGSRNGIVQFWNLDNNSRGRTFNNHSKIVSSVAFSPDGQLFASASYDKTIKLMDLSNEHIISIDSHKDKVNAIAFSPDSLLLASASGDRTVGLWNTTTRASKYVLIGHLDEVRAIAFSPDGQTLASGSSDTSIRLWDVATGALRGVRQCHQNLITQTKFSPTGQLLATASDNEVRLWDPATGACRGVLERQLGQVRAIAFSLDGQLLATASDKEVRLWDPANRASRGVLKGQPGWAEAMAFSPDGQLLATASDQDVRLWDVATRAPRAILQGELGQVKIIAFSPDSQLLATASDNEIKYWDLTTKALHSILRSQSSQIEIIAFSLDSQLLATTSDQEVRLWDPATGAPHGVLEDQLSQVKAMAFSPDGQLLATILCGDVRLWDPATGASCGVLKGQLGQVKAIAFCPDGQLLVIAHNVGSPKQGIQALKPSHVQSKVCIFRHILTHKTIFWCCVEDSIESLSFSPDWRYLMTNRGAVNISWANTPRRPSSPYLYAKEQWVMWKNERVLWLPPEYRTACPSVHGNMLALGDSSGQFFLLNFGSKLSSDESDDDGDVWSVDGPDSI